VERLGEEKERSRVEEGGVGRGVGVSSGRMEWCGVAGCRASERVCEMSVYTQEVRLPDIVKD
jgi:hypothetical protein